MTLEQRYVADVNDIIAIRLTCNKCTASINIPFSQRDYLPESCPYCRESWFIPKSNDFNHTAWLLAGISSLRERGENQPCQIAFELPMPK
jgi:hypothetical protein